MPNLLFAFGAPKCVGDFPLFVDLSKQHYLLPRYLFGNLLSRIGLRHPLFVNRNGVIILYINMEHLLGFLPRWIITPFLCAVYCILVQFLNLFDSDYGNSPPSCFPAVGSHPYEVVREMLVDLLRNSLGPTFPNVIHDASDFSSRARIWLVGT